MEEHERPHYGNLIRALNHLDPWLSRVDSEAPCYDVDQGSSLGGDDRRTHPYQISHAAWHSLSHAVDHLHMLRSTLRDARAIHMYAPYTLVRGALENASAAVWLLKPARRPDRLRRRLRFAAVDMRNGEKARQLVGGIGPRPLEQRLADLRTIARQAGIDEHKALERVGYEEIVRSAGEALPSGSTASVFVWRMCSGIAHGDLWTTISVAERVELEGAPPGMTHLKVTANVKTLLFVTLAALDMASTGWDLFDIRSRSPFR